MSYKSVFLKLTGAAFIAQAFSVVFIPILTRIYTPESFAVFSLWISIGGLLGGGLTFKIEQFLLSRSILEWPPILNLLIYIYKFSFCFFCFVSIFCFLFIDFVEYLVVVFVLIYCFLTSVIMFFSVVANVLNKFELLGKARILISLILGILQICFGLISNTPESLILGAIGSQLIFIYTLYPCFKNIEIDDSVTVFKFTRDDAKKCVASVFSSITLTIATSFLPVMMLALDYKHEAGVVAILQRFLMLPINLLATPLSHVFIAYLRETKIIYINFRYCFFGFLIFIISCLLIYQFSIFLGDIKIFNFILGEEWDDADVMISSVVFVYISIFFRNVLLPYYIVREKQLALIIVDLLFITLLCCSFLFANLGFLNFEDFLIYINKSYVFYMVVNFIIIYFLEKKRADLK